MLMFLIIMDTIFFITVPMNSANEELRLEKDARMRLGFLYNTFKLLS